MSQLYGHGYRWALALLVVCFAAQGVSSASISLSTANNDDVYADGFPLLNSFSEDFFSLSVNRMPVMNVVTCAKRYFVEIKKVGIEAIALLSSASRIVSELHKEYSGCAMNDFNCKVTAFVTAFSKFLKEQVEIHKFLSLAQSTVHKVLECTRDIPRPTPPTTPTSKTPKPTTSTPIIPSHTTPSPTTPSHTTPSPTTPSPTTPSYTTPSPTTPSPTTPSHTTPSPTTPSHTTPSPTTPSPTTPSHTTPSPTTPSHTTPSHTTPSHTTPSPTTPSHTTPSHTTPSHTTPSPTTPSPTYPSSTTPSTTTPASTIPTTTDPALTTSGPQPQNKDTEDNSKETIFDKISESAKNTYDKAKQAIKNWWSKGRN